MYNFIINDGKENHTIEEVPDEVGIKLLEDAKQASKMAKLYDFAPGDICKYDIDKGKPVTKEDFFCLTKVWFNSIGDGRFNAIYQNGDVIEDGTLSMIKKCGSIHTHLFKLYDFFLKELDEEE